MDITAIAGIVRPGDTLVLGIHPNSDFGVNLDKSLREVRELLPDVPIVVILGVESMAIHRGSNNKGAANSGAPTGDEQGQAATVPDDRTCNHRDTDLRCDECQRRLHAAS